jgi:hypothetical protein
MKPNGESNGALSEGYSSDSNPFEETLTKPDRWGLSLTLVFKFKAMLKVQGERWRSG